MAATVTEDQPTFTEKTAFANIVRFPVVGDDNLIETKPFLDACSGVLSVLDKLGSAFSVPKKDVQGNIKRVTECYETDPNLYKTVNVFMEKKQSPGSLLWLKRALQFLLAFIDSILQDHINGTEKESLRQNVLQAYEPTLKPYHGKMTQFLFSNISRLVPHRKDFLVAMLSEPDATLDMVFHDLQLYLPDFRRNVQIVNDLLVQHGLDEQKVV
ncbi:C1orf50 homolog [Plakobranchus ocellatus]|uniref:C1orf50 homolog n=1 Tax=Plakobranchus ocellatus TaxID=259542 RepID=A0AAV4CIZ0_9GAST|nr:C1orf50 homolog [Plakobranchus ocellatus]